MRKCPVCQKNFSKGKWALGMFDTYCPHCNAHLRVAIDWRCIPLLVLLCIGGALCSIHIIFKIFTVVIGVCLWLYLCNLPYKQV